MVNVEQTDDIEDTVHKNPFILDAAGLFLDLADSHDLPEKDLEFVFSRFFHNPQWKWAPITNIKRVCKGLHAMSIGSAASTQDSSLYLFEEKMHYKMTAAEEVV